MAKKTWKHTFEHRITSGLESLPQNELRALVLINIKNTTNDPAKLQ